MIDQSYRCNLCMNPIEKTPDGPLCTSIAAWNKQEQPLFRYETVDPEFAHIHICRQCWTGLKRMFGNETPIQSAIFPSARS